MTTMQSVRAAPRRQAEGRATILAIGTANPTNCVYQNDYPDFYFRVTNSEHMTELKHKFKRICEKSTIRKRYTHLTEEILKENPNICTFKAPSLDARQEILVAEVPKLGHEAALRAIEEWGQPILKITHLIFCTTSGIAMPGADYQLTKLLGLKPTVKRFMIYNQACFAGGTALRLAKDLAENNCDARILIVCSEIMAMFFHAPSETSLDMLIGQALFSDGAAAVIVGAESFMPLEQPLFEIVSAEQTIIPNSDGAMVENMGETGITFCMKETIPSLIGTNVEMCMVDAFKEIGIGDWNSLFYAVHPGGPAILKQIERILGLKEEKLKASREVLSEYGNMGAPSVLFILDELRKKSREEGKRTTGEGIEWGVLLGFGPGLTAETIVLHSFPFEYKLSVPNSQGL